jgi:Ca-activated chloride channel family protein
MDKIMNRTTLTVILVSLFIGTQAAAWPFDMRRTTEEASNVVSVTIEADQDKILNGDCDAMAMIEVTGSDDGRAERVPVAIALVLDSSGSMRGQKIEDAKRAATALVEQLYVGDIVTVISYDNRARGHLNNYVITEDRFTAYNAISQIQANGNTCISCGINLAYGALSTAPSSHVRRMVMLSDGNANEGVVTDEGLRGLAAQASGSRGIVSSTIGLGTDYNEGLMTAMSSGGTGNYYFLPGANAISRVLEREFASLSTTVATQVTLIVKPENGVTLRDSDAVGSSRDGNSLVITVGQLSQGQTRQFLVPVNLPPGDLGTIITVEASYTPVNGSPTYTVASLELVRTDDPTLAAASLNRGVASFEARLETADDVDAAMSLYGGGNVEAAQNQLQERAEILRSQAVLYGDAVLEEEAEAIEELADEISGASSGSTQGLSIQRQNRARGMEVRDGTAPAEMFHE